MGAGAWRSRACALALMLTLYLAIAALISGLHDAVSSIPRSLSVTDFAAPPKYSPKVTELDLHQRMRSALEFAGGGLVGWGTGGKTSGRFRPRLIWCSQLRYQRPPGPAVALASFPGSGNTWLRYLLQQATGIYTGSVYKDYGLMKNGFPAESISNGSALVVKTHEWGPAAREPFSRALLLVRQPAAAILAEFNRQSGGHVGFAAPERYRRMKGKYWQQFVVNKLAAWKQTNLDWLYNFTGPTHIVFYDQLVGDVEHTLRGILNFLGVPINRSQFACAITRKEGIYRRKKRLLNFDPFTPQMKLILQHEQEIVYQALYSALSGTTNNVNNYS